MPSVQQHKCAEAAALLKQAEKALSKRSFFRGSSDYLTAAPLLEKAGELFRLGGDFEASKQAFTRCADAQKHNQSPFRAAQAWENVAKTALQQLKDERSGSHNSQLRATEARTAYETASSFYADMGEFGKAADALVKGAQACESHGSSADDVLPLYWRACDLLEAQDKPHFAVETFRKTLSFLVKYGKYSDAIKLSDRLKALYEAMDQRHNIHKMHLSQVILMLALGDVPAADALYSRSLQDDSFLSSDDCALAEDLVRAFKMGNEELLQATVRKPGFLALDNQLGRICRKLSVFGSGPPQQQNRPVSSGRERMQLKQQSSSSAPSARVPQTQRNPFAPSARSAAGASLNSEYDVSASEVEANTSDVRDSDYEAMLAEALGEGDVSKGKRKTNVKKKRHQHSAMPEPSAHSSALSPTVVHSPLPGAMRASGNMSYEDDDLAFAMPDSGFTELSINPGDMAAASYSESSVATTQKGKAPATKPAPKDAYDEFDLT
ncbi:soluble nsf attachment protein gamma isoform [Plasmopara halstedii]|uniref:Gamma-soluble NSF attachment protein n=1 Tax=Plasmopara halstedii TaxID=4781 RepID=A0A0N7L647_PLAHL|nr:soluble nsf attachment protein gamma isoform [Plasmopara halstedii]CEG43267.1 soluble nsf attachment protein gamma isoform [Plasmopara halstedii]|eukprot:XP_024579636.1 soluble nsf attachment protein gamma isoform [Plasmopara halstedii]